MTNDFCSTFSIECPSIFVAPVVQQVRGSLGAHEQGLIITTSDFSTGAVKEAAQPDKTPIALMNGEQLVALLMDYNIGVRRISHDLFELEELPPENLISVNMPSTH